jgi:anti-sigma factor RsiW
MTCEQIDELLSDLLDGELPAEQQRAAELHLQSCDACADSYKRLKRTVRFVRANSNPPLTPGTPGGWYAQFTRSHMDLTLENSALDVSRQGGGLP